MSRKKEYYLQLQEAMYIDTYASPFTWITQVYKVTTKPFKSLRLWYP